MPSSPRQTATRIVADLQNAGHVAYFAGGCVRDKLLGLEPADYDIATDATPDIVRKIFRGSRYVGESFGVVLVHRDGHALEIATFRREWGYDDHRRPDHVEFTDAQQDAQRRDFTINALFENPTAIHGHSEIVDYVGGRADLDNRILRAVGNPDHRFNEDKLRLLRAVRFAARFNLTLDPDTESAIRANAPGLAHISRERIGHEIRRMLTPPPLSPGTTETDRQTDPHTQTSPHPALRAIQLLDSLNLTLPTLTPPSQPPLTADGRRPSGPHPPPPHHHATLTALTAQPHPAAFPLALAAWALDRHNHDIPTALANASRWRRALCLSNDDRNALRDILTAQPILLDWPNLDLARRKRLLAQPHANDALSLLAAWNPTPDVPDILDNAQKLRLNADVAPTPILTGEDLLKKGLKPGPRIGRLLAQAYDQQLNGHFNNRHDALQWLDQQSP